MNQTDIAQLRLKNQQLAATKFTTGKELVSWMGAMQAQDYAMAKWAIGVRLPGSTIDSVEQAIRSGEIIRTHLLRPTWHWVAADDLRWMLALTAPRILSAMKSRHRELELSPPVVAKSIGVFEKALTGGRHLTREALMNELEKSKIATGGNRASHLFLLAELEGIICSGASEGNNYTYALLSERVPESEKLPREEAVARLVQRYFTSHGPATPEDFAWWSGLSATDARKGVEMIRPALISETINGKTYWMTDHPGLSPLSSNRVYLLPAFDEFIISYKDRSSALNHHNHVRAVSSNGLFRPVILVNGQVAGRWKRTLKKEILNIEPDFFENFPASALEALNTAMRKTGHFWKKKTEMVLPDR